MKATENVLIENDTLYINGIEIIHFEQEIGDDPFDDPNNDGIAII